MARLLAATAVAVALLVGPPAAAQGAIVDYRPPVDAPVADPFRPPASPYGAGNRGVDYATVAGTPVRAAADGEVTFAGPVGGRLHVVVSHADGIRTSYSFLASLAVRRGQRLAQGQVVGDAGSSLHFGARRGDEYIDPLGLFRPASRRVHLVPERAEEGGSRERWLGAPGRGGAVAGSDVVWARRRGVAAGAGPHGADLLPFRLAQATGAWLSNRASCTPPHVAPPPPGGRRLAVLVGGLGSTSGPASVDAVDVGGLGYAPADVVRFSYLGGTTAERPYSAEDTHQDLGLSGQRLRALLERLQAAHPGVPIDVIAHSQGGLVARSALGPRPPPAVANILTLGTPHQGADLATALARIGPRRHGPLVRVVAAPLAPAGTDGSSTSLRQLAERSPFLLRLDAAPLPQGVRVTSIAARGDVLVASPRSRLEGAVHTVVTVPGWAEHRDLPGSAEARREMALALAGRPPTCRSGMDAVVDTVVGEAIGLSQDAAGHTVSWLAR